VILGKVGHQAKWNNKALPLAANEHTFHQMRFFPILPLFQALCHQTCLHRPIAVLGTAVSLSGFCFFYV